jgi:predicted permease
VSWLTVIARLGPGMTAARAEAALQPVLRSILEDELTELGSRGPRDREEYIGRKVELVPAPQGVNDLGERLKTPLFSMMALVGVVLLIACVNIAGLLLARAAGRSRDVAIRLALGAGRWVLIRQLLAESVTLALAGGAAGLIVASWSMNLLATFAPENVGRLLAPELDTRILLFNFALATATGIVFGLWPAFQATRTSVIEALKDQSAGGGEARRHVRMRAGSVVVQVALSTLLLVAGGLFARSVYNLKALDPGFRVEDLLTFSVNPELSGYSRERGHALYSGMLRRLELLPGVRSATAGAIPVLTDTGMSGNITVEGYQPAEDERMDSSRNFITPEYFSTMGIPLVRGREINEQDRDGGPKVCVVNEAFVTRYFKDSNPIGRKMTFGSGDVTLDTEIVGVVKNQKSGQLKEETQIFTYTPVTQERGLPAMTFYLRTASDDSSLGPAVRGLVREMDANLPVEEVKTVAIVRDESIAVDRMFATLSISFAAVATLLAAIGLYGLLAYTVARRTREIGVRMALGALRRDVFRLVLGDAFRYVALGLALGIGGAFALARYLESQLFGLQARDPWTFGGAVAVLTLAALLASMLPARRAAGVEPIRALREE